MPSIRLEALAICLAAALGWPPSAAAADLPIIDAHSQADQEIDLERIISLMDEAGVVRTILAARSQRKPEELAAFAARHPDRITAAVRSKSGVYMKNKLGRFKKFLQQQAAMPEFGALAEVLIYHAEKRNRNDRFLAPQVAVPPGDPRVAAVLSLARQRTWPFVAHIEFASIGADRDAYMRGFEDLLRGNPGHPFVLIHMGQLGPAEVRRLIEAHGNVYFIAAHTNPISVENSIEPWVNMFDGEHLGAPWRALVIRHPDRFILGFDNVWERHWTQLYLRQVALWRKALADLPDAVAHAVAHGKAERLWHLPPAR